MKPAKPVILCACLATLLFGDPNVQVNSGGVPATGTVGKDYSGRVTASDGRQPYQFSVASGPLPGGLSLSSSGSITGTPVAVGIFNFSIRVTDRDGDTATRSFTITILPGPPAPPLSVSTTSPLPTGTVGSPYSQSLEASGGAPPYRWSGSAPAGLTLSTAGLVNGVPAAPGTFNFTATVTDSASTTARRDFAITIDAAALTITTSTLPGGSIGAPYSQQLSATGGAPPFTWSISSGSLPAGLGLNAGSGLLSGAPSVVGSSTFTARVRDSRGTVFSRQFTIAIARNVVITTGTQLPNPILGTAYTVTLNADGGAPPYNWAITGGAPPNGLSLDAATGRLSGTPSAPGQFSFVVRVTDGAGAAASMQFSLSVAAPAVPALSLSSIPDVASAAQQLAVDLTLASSYPLPITGQVTMKFVPDPEVGSDDPAVQFATGGRSVSFTISANSTQPASPIALQTGSVAGTIELQVTAPGAGAALSRTIRIGRSAPTIRNLTVVRNATGFELRVVGLSTSRALTQATVRFTGAGLLTSDVNIPLSDVARGWYVSPASVPFGSQFSLVLPFTVQGDSNAIQSATLTVSNAEGASPPLSAAFSGR